MKKLLFVILLSIVTINSYNQSFDFDLDNFVSFQDHKIAKTETEETLTYTQIIKRSPLGLLDKLYPWRTSLKKQIKIVKTTGKTSYFAIVDNKPAKANEEEIKYVFNKQIQMYRFK